MRDRHLTPAFTLGLTATPGRPDGRPILEIFHNAAHRLSLEETIRRGKLVPIRCVRVKTDIDLTKVRFNEVSNPGVIVASQSAPTEKAANGPFCDSKPGAGIQSSPNPREPGGFYRWSLDNLNGSPSIPP